MMIMKPVRWLVGLFIKDYLIFDIYKIELENLVASPAVPAQYRFQQITTTDEISQSSDPDLKKCVSAINPESNGFGIWKSAGIVGVCWIWSGQHYKKKRNFLPLQANEAELVFLSVAKSARGEGLAKLLIHHASYLTKQANFTRIYARIWHSNTPSIRSFQNAGWVKHSKVFEIRFKGINTPLRIDKIVKS